VKVNLDQAQALTGELKFSSYAALDTTGTLEIYQLLEKLLDPDQRRIYEWNKKQLAPSLAMTLRGIRVDQPTREKLAKGLEKTLVKTEAQIAQLPSVTALWDGWELETGRCRSGPQPKKVKIDGKMMVVEYTPLHKWPRSPEKGKKLPTEGMLCERCGAARRRYKPFEPGSAAQVKHLLYDLHKLPYRMDKTGKVTANEEALASLAEMESPRKFLGTRELCTALLEHRDLVKQLGFLRAKLSPKGRFHASFNVAAAWTGRWSSSKDPFGVGSNLQNIGEQHRHIFLSDPGMTMFYADLKTAESLLVAYLSGEENYIEAHKGDVHTYVCRLLWPDEPWTGDIKKDKKIASTTLPAWDNVPGHDLRFQSKRVQHGSNYGLTPYGMARIAHIPVAVAVEAQRAYFTAFPNIREWQKSIAALVKGGLPIYNALRRVVWLMGRPWDDHTRKQGLSFPPQGGVGDVLNLGLYRVWRDCDPQLIMLLAQVHDAILGQFPDEMQSAALEALRRLMSVPHEVQDIYGKVRTCTIPVEIAIGKNWGKRGAENPEGLKEVA
jgi:DNA polymerase I-like protein with 3'-5' exonuclease and polymerase domains